MNLNKILLSKFILIFFLVLSSHSIENKIILKIDQDIITSLDIENEKNYLSALNPNIKELDDKKIFEISKNSLIREKIKKIEILKNTNVIELDNNFLEKIIETRYMSLGLKTKNEFITYLKKFEIEISTVIKKIEIEALWNQMIFLKFSKNININKEDLKKEIELNSNSNETRELFLKEIVFNIQESSNFNKEYNLIKKSILETGFENTASLYSISDTAKTGGTLGWFNENSLNPKINEALLGLDLKEYSEPITIPGGFLILQISEKRVVKEKIDIEMELKKMINDETNRQLNQFSNIYYNKVKQEISINEI
ncbi:peptidyl-prolyl cis-trans isomerase [Candidatus Pelagibacter sp.]|nr:peptidyl-prolyl cis-trans isomerase [Candidatus Pelagibacter sp.]